MVDWDARTEQVARSLRLAGVGADPSSKARLFVAFWSRSALRRLGRPGVLPQRVRLADRETGASAPFFVRFMHELNAIHEVFIDRHYDVGLGEDPKTILDLGANSGVATAYLAMRFPRAVIHAVEADPAMAALLAENVAGLPRVHVHHLAVGAKDGETCFFTDAGRPLSSSIRRRSPTQVEVRVPCRTLDTLLDQLGLDEVDLVKFDIEGAEGLVFPGSEAARRRIRRAVGELHLRVPGCGRDAVVSAFGDARRVSVICSDDEHELVDIRPTAA